jgi:hypothetical protein
VLSAQAQGIPDDKQNEIRSLEMERLQRIPETQPDKRIVLFFMLFFFLHIFQLLYARNKI